MLSDTSFEEKQVLTKLHPVHRVMDREMTGKQTTLSIIIFLKVEPWDLSMEATYASVKGN